jgi:hypothetical protein
VTALKKKSEATKCSDHCTISVLAHTAKDSSNNNEMKIEDAIGENQFGFRRG